MPRLVSEIKDSDSACKVSLRAKLLHFLKDNRAYGYTLKELVDIFYKEFKTKYPDKKVLYKLISDYLRQFRLQNLIKHRGNYYYFKYEKKK